MGPSSAKNGFRVLRRAIPRPRRRAARRTCARGFVGLDRCVRRGDDERSRDLPGDAHDEKSHRTLPIGSHAPHLKGFVLAELETRATASENASNTTERAAPRLPVVPKESRGAGRPGHGESDAEPSVRCASEATNGTPAPRSSKGPSASRQSGGTASRPTTQSGAPNSLDVAGQRESLLENDAKMSLRRTGGRPRALSSPVPLERRLRAVAERMLLVPLQQHGERSSRSRWKSRSRILERVRASTGHERPASAPA